MAAWLEGAVELVDAKPFGFRQERDIGQPVGGTVWKCSLMVVS
jgi:hypothetical protein